MNVIFHPEAEEEMIESATYYEEKVPGLGADFLNSVDMSVDQILLAPERWRAVATDVRRYLMARFPFGIHYQIRTDYIQIVSISHFSRHPDYWKHRIE